MDVTAWRSATTYGIRVGAANRSRHFDRGWDEIEVTLDDGPHRFALTPGFWRHCPEFRDRGQAVIRAWLQRHKDLPWPHGHPPRMQLTALGGNRFRLLP